MLKIIKKILGKVIRMIYRISYKFIPCNEKTVLFISFHGRGYVDNPKALHLQMMNDPYFKEYKFIWAIKHHKSKKVKGAKVIEYFSIPYFFYLARSKYWICNCKLPSYVLKKNTQIYLQTWHGTPLKRLGHDIVAPEGTTFYRSGMSIDEMKKTYDNDVMKYDYMISPNRFCTEVFQSAFGIERGKLIETGYPRNDVLINTTASEVEKIKNKLNIPLDKKVVLYAPTWRDNQFVTAGYTFELKADFHKWKEALGDEYVLIFKPHYLIINKYQSDKSLNGFLYSIDANADINDLYLISDILITDYSSVFFDFAILNRPVLFYMYDIEEYKDELRGFYLDIYKDLPGEIYIDEANLLDALTNQDYSTQKLEMFNKRFNHCEDGNASRRVLDIVFRNEKKEI